MRKTATILLLLFTCPCVHAYDAGKFRWVQLDMGQDCDPYPGALDEAARFVSDATSIVSENISQKIKISDDALFNAPLVMLACRSVNADLGEDEVQRLRAYLSAGGTLWIDDSVAARYTPFDRWVRRTLGRIFPDTALEPLQQNHPIFRSFFLMRSLGGRSAVNQVIEGINIGSRTAVIYSRTDILGVWIKDSSGKPLYPCVPGGEVQRMNGKKLTLNLIMYSLTGSYKMDAVHQPYIMQKLRERDAK